jgi:hypothetical protein
LERLAEERQIRGRVHGAMPVGVWCTFRSHMDIGDHRDSVMAGDRFSSPCAFGSDRS